MKVIKKARTRTLEESRELTATVEEIINEVRTRGDKALIEYNIKFDKNHRKVLRVSREEIDEAYREIDPKVLDAIKIAAKNIENFALAQKSTQKSLEEIEVYPGVFAGHRIIPIDSCLCYVPGGGYPLFSTALMLAIPAKVAGVKRITACSPTIHGTGKIHPTTLVAMDLAGVEEIYALGGAHAIAAFTYGTDEIKSVDIIVGPGNQYVTEAKRQCYGTVGIDFIAGPSEVLIIADESANPEILAADILGQSEHDLMAKGILITTSEKIAFETIEAVERQLNLLPTSDIARTAWEVNGEVIAVDNIEDACKISNEYAPEHLEVVINNPEEIIEKLTNYGSLFIGDMAAEVFGDYVSGPNHTLPTLKAARYTGGVWVGTFTKVCTHQRLTKEGMQKLSPITSLMARAEGLHAHANAADIRLKLIK
ncbi:MAG: histidinol dehydrogenase [Clostridiales bacterium]|nr:histidinol dehydrogenase [Clostridiales bacterium]